MTQQRFRAHINERLSEIALYLAAQRVEIIGRRRNIRDLHIILSAHL